MDIGGIPRYIADLSLRHRAQGHDIVVASTGGMQVDVLQKAGVRHVTIPLSSKFEFGPNLWRSLHALKPLLRQEQFDVTHAHTRIAQVLGALLQRQYGIPSVTTCHGFFKPNLGRKLWPCWGKKVIAVSPAVREDLIRRHKVPAETIVCIANGIDAVRFLRPDEAALREVRGAMNIPERARVIGTTARLSPVKGLEFLLEALFLLRSQYPDLICLIVGDGPSREKLSALTASLGLENAVRFAGAVQDVAPYLALMDVFVLPSLMEGLGLSILEAFAAGKPVVASRVGGIPNVIEDGHNGLLTEPADARGLADAMDKVLDDKALAQRLAEEGLRTVNSRFSLDRMAEQIAQVYQNFLFQASVS